MLNPEAQKALDNICIKEVHELTETDIGFLKARRSYLTSEMLQKYESILQDKPQAVDKTETLSYRDLQRHASSLGIKSVGKTYADLIKLVKEHNG